MGDVITEFGSGALELNVEQKTCLDRLSAWAASAKDSTDSKAKAILDWLNVHLRPGGKWNDDRVILFTEYRATHTWLFEILTNHGYGGDRLAELHGGLDHEEREKITAAFQANPNISPVPRVARDRCRV